MSLFSKLFGGSSKSEQPSSEDYNGFTIIEHPMPEGTQFRLSVRIEKDGKSHHLIRADTLGSQDAAHEAAVLKAKQLIDQMGDRLF